MWLEGCRERLIISRVELDVGEVVMLGDGLRHISRHCLLGGGGEGGQTAGAEINIKQIQEKPESVGERIWAGGGNVGRRGWG